jgi:hypothetical protein
MHNTKIRLVFLLSVVVLLSSCTLYQIDSRDTSTDFYPPKNSASAVTYIEIVTHAHDVIGYVTVNAERYQDLESVLEKMKREAAILGGDAITDIRTNGGTGKWAQIKPKELFGNANVRTNFIATVVAFK